MDKVEDFARKKFTALSTNLQKVIMNEINRGAHYRCEEPKCTHEWDAKPKHIVEKCPKCNSHRITLMFKKIFRKNKRELGGVHFFSDWP